jgi:outer membrane protein
MRSLRPCFFLPISDWHSHCYDFGQEMNILPRGRKILMIAICCGMANLWKTMEVIASQREMLTLEEVRQRVLDFNESIQMRLLDYEISRQVFQAERGIFEPQVVGSYDRVDTERPNTIQQQAGAFFTPIFRERNNIYDGGLEFLLPTGTQLRQGVSFRDLSNNLQALRGVDREYEAFVGLRVVQPLLKNFGPGATMVRIRLAAVASDQAFEEYRRHLMLIVARTEAFYWDLYLGQEQERLAQESVALAERILEDNRHRVELGVAPEVEVLESEANVASRQALLQETELLVSEGANRLATLFSDFPLEVPFRFRAADEPAPRDDGISYFESQQLMFSLNPDYRIQQYQVRQEEIRMGYAKNQRLPQLDLRGNYGYSGLGLTPGEAWQNIGRTDFPSWSVGVELRIPVTGGIRERHTLKAARLGHQRASVGLSEIEVQIANALQNAVHRVQSYGRTVESYRTVVAFHERLLESQLARLEVGATTSRIIFETEEKLFEAQIARLENLIQYQKSLLELELITGSTLQLRGLEVTQEELRARIAELLQSGKWNETAFHRYARVAEFDFLEPDGSSHAIRRATHVLRQETGTESPALPALTPAQQEEALQVLRRRMRQMDETTLPAFPR